MIASFSERKFTHTSRTFFLSQGDQKSMELEAEPVANDRGPFPSQRDIDKSISNAYLRLVASDFQFGNDGENGKAHGRVLACYRVCLFLCVFF